MASYSLGQDEIMVSLKSYGPIGALGFVVMVVCASLSWQYWTEHYAAPTKYLSVAVLTRTIYPGESLKIRTTSDRRKECFGKVDRFLVRITGKDEFLAFHDRTDTTPASVGESVNVVFQMATPANLEPGNYVYRAFVNLPETCTGKPWRIPVPEASFRVCSRDDLHCKD